MKTSRAILTLCLAGSLAGCAATEQASEVQESGFLGSETYALLQAGEEGRAVLSYVSADANFGQYDKVILEPVTIWGDPDDAALQPEDRTMLADVTYSAFHEALAKDYEIVTEPGPTTMAVAVAITSAEAGDPALNTVSSIVPQARLLRGAASFFTEKPAFVGEAQGEVKATDSTTGELLGAGVDRRFGSQSPRVTTDSWEDVVAIIDYWSELTRFRLCQERGGSDCVAPEA